MKIDLAAMVRRAGSARRKAIDLPVIHPTRAFEQELAAIYMRMVRRLAELARDRLIPAYTRALAQAQPRDSMVRDDIPELQGELDGIGDELNRLVLTLAPEMRDWTLRMERWHRGKWQSGTLTATGVDISVLVGPDDALEPLATVLARNVSLIRDVSTEAQGRIADAVWRGFQQRLAARELAKQLDGIIDMSRKRALRIAADQLQKLSSEMDSARMRAAGITSWVWRHSHKLHPRPEHVARDGKVYTDKTAPEDEPGELPFCGCKKMARLVLNE